MLSCTFSFITPTCFGHPCDHLQGDTSSTLVIAQKRAKGSPRFVTADFGKHRITKITEFFKTAVHAFLCNHWCIACIVAVRQPE